MEEGDEGAVGDGCDLGGFETSRTSTIKAKEGILGRRRTERMGKCGAY